MLNSSKQNKNVGLTEDQLDPRLESCPACGSVERTTVTILQDKPQIKLETCHNCCLSYSDRQPTNQFLREYYKGYYDHKKDNVNIPVTKLANYIFKEAGLGHSKKTQWKLFDFGGGDGSVVIELAKKILEVNPNAKILITVVDYNFETREVSPAIQVEGFQMLTDVPADRTYDVVVASAIIEHVKNAIEVTDRLVQSLNPEGVIYIRTPYALPFYKFVKRFGVKMDLQYPAHLFDMGKEYWEWYFTDSQRVEGVHLLKSVPSMPEATLLKSPFKAIAINSIKSPWYLFPHQYKLVGGWQIIAQKR